MVILSGLSSAALVESVGLVGVVAQVGGVTASTTLTSLTSDATNSIKGAWVQLIAATAAKYTHATINIVSALTGGWMIDIGVGGAGAEVVVIPDVYVRMPTASTSASILEVPVQVAAGSRVAARCAYAANGASVVGVQVVLSG